MSPSIPLACTSLSWARLEGNWVADLCRRPCWPERQGGTARNWSESTTAPAGPAAAPMWDQGHVTSDAFLFVHRTPIDGGLLSYGPDPVDNFRPAATFVDRILRGAKPADLPVQFPTKFETAVNLKTAKSLGLTVPQSILLRADEVIGRCLR
jgi:hypothetical protein